MENEKLRATPAARSLAKRLGIDLFKIQGSGAKGRVHKEDVEVFNYEKRIHISPLAAKIAADYGIDLENVTGSGHNGKIMRDDIMKLIGKSQETQEPVKKEEAKAVKQEQAVGDTETIPMSPMRKVIAKRMSESYFTAPTFNIKL